MPNMCGRRELCHFSALWLTRSVLLGQSELHLAVLHHNKKTTQQSPKFFFQLPQPSTFNPRLSKTTYIAAFGKTFYPHSSYGNHCKGLYACWPCCPSFSKLMSRWSFHTRLTLGSYFISPSTLRFSRDLNYPTSLKSLLSLVIIPPSDTTAFAVEAFSKNVFNFLFRSININRF